MYLTKLLGLIVCWWFCGGGGVGFVIRLSKLTKPEFSPRKWCGLLFLRVDELDPVKLSPRPFISKGLGLTPAEQEIRVNYPKKIPSKMYVRFRRQIKKWTNMFYCC